MADNLFWSEEEWDQHLENVQNNLRQRSKNHMKHSFGEDSYDDWERAYSRKNSGKKQKKNRREVYQ